MTPAAYAALRRHAEEDYPEECCGVLLGRAEGEVRSVSVTVRAGNARQDAPRNRYSIAPRELVRIQREARAAGLEIAGFYHSHPDEAARWSATDFAEAYWIGCSYVITSVEKGAAQATRSFVLRGSVEEDKRFEEEEIAVEETPPGGGDE